MKPAEKQPPHRTAARENVYFDNAAAGRISGDVLARFNVLAREYFSNQESAASPDKAAIHNSSLLLRSMFCGKARASGYEVLFTHTGTEAVQALFSALEKHFPKGGKILVSGGEHACVRAAAMRLKERFHVSGIPCGQDGRIRPEDLEKAATPDTILAAVHFVQPETGVVQNLPILREVLERSVPGALLFTDAIQGACKVPFDFEAVRPGFFTVSGQKLGLPAGAALIFRKDFTPLFNALRFQEHCVGRLPPFFAVLLAGWCESLSARMEEFSAHAQSLKKLLFRELEARIPGKFRRTVPELVPQSPYIAHLLLSGPEGTFQGAIIARALAEQGIFTAPGSACDAESREPSHALRWMGLLEKEAFSALRISFSQENTPEEVRTLAGALAGILARY